MPMQRTPDEIHALERAWVADPDWDLEDSEGFEAHRGELYAFSARKKAQWEAQAHEKRMTRMAELGVSGNDPLFDYITRLERRVEELHGRLDALSEIVYRLEGS